MALSYAAESEGYASGSQLDSGKYTSWSLTGIFYLQFWMDLRSGTIKFVQLNVDFVSKKHEFQLQM